MALNFSQLSDKQLEALGMKKCPFNRSHVVKQSRFQIHVIDCESKMNTWERNKWTTCPFNASHRIPVDQMDYHLNVCPENRQFLREAMEVMRKNRINESTKRSVGDASDIIGFDVKEEPLNGLNTKVEGFKIKEEVVDPSVKRKVFIDRSDSKDIEDLKIEIKQEVKDEVKDVIRDKIKEEAKEEEVKPKMKVEEEDDWYDPKFKDYDIYQLPKSTTAEDIMKNEKYLLENRGFVDHMSYSNLSSFERRRLLQLMVEKNKKMAAKARVPKNTDHCFHFHPLTKAIKEENSSTEVNNPLAVIQQREEVWPPTQHPVGEGLRAFNWRSRLHSVSMPVDYTQLVVSDQCGHHNRETSLSTALRSVALSEDKKPNLTEVVFEGPLRMPISNPWFHSLRKPKAGSQDSQKVVPKQEVNNN